MSGKALGPNELKILPAQSAPRCGAHSRRNGGAPCKCPAMKGKKRCRIHGGKSTGPSKEGRERLSKLWLKHGGRSRRVIELRSEVSGIRRSIAKLCALADHT